MWKEGYYILNKKTGYYNEGMNGDTLQSWSGEILSKLDPGNVMDNAPYHSDTIH
jgi:hypothetical protein